MDALTLRGRSRTRIEIDLNSRDRDGYVRARLARANRGVAVGDEVTVFEPDDRVAAVARVVRLDSKSGFVYLTVYWDTLADDVDFVQVSMESPARNSWQEALRLVITSKPAGPQWKVRREKQSTRKRIRRALFRSSDTRVEALVTAGGKTRTTIDAQAGVKTGTSTGIPVRLQKVS